MNDNVENLQDYFTEKTTYHIGASKLQDLLQQVYKKHIEMTESPNDTTHEFVAENNNDEYEWDKETVEKAVEEGYLPCYQYYAIFNDLCTKGYIKPGRYFVRVSW